MYAQSLGPTIGAGFRSRGGPALPRSSLQIGELGRYLHTYRLTSDSFQSPRKGFYDLGDVAALVDPDLACWDVTPCPEVGWDLGYRFTDKLGAILRCYHVDRDRTFELLYRRLAALG